MFRGTVVAIALVLSLIVATPATAATRYASPAGAGPAGAGGCPESDPCGLEPAVENASVVDGDVVLLLPGTYSVGSGSVSVSDAITLKPRDPGTRPTISGTGNQVLDVDAGATIQDLAVTDTSSSGTGVSASLGVFSGAEGAILQRLTVETTVSRTGGLNEAEIACGVNTGTLRDSVCHLTTVGSSVVGLAALSGNAGGAHQTNLINVVAWGTEGPSATGVIGLQAQGVAAGENAMITAKNVIAHGDGQPSVQAVGENGGAASITLSNSDYPNAAVLDNASVTPAGTGTNQTIPPSLVNPAAGDFHQLAGSVTIDHGATDTLLGTTDLDFEARNQGGVPDIGADEFNLPGTPTITATSPTSPADNNTPSVLGTADAGTTVSLYDNSACSGAPLGAGTAAAFASPGIAITVGDNTTTELHALATDPRGHTASCSASFDYVENTPPPPGEPPPGEPEDIDPPQTKIKSAPDKVIKTQKRKVPFEIKFTANEDATFQCELDDKRAKKCSSPFAGKVGKGFHVVEITATDLAGNREDKPAKVKWRVKRADGDN
jgi:hypothetical protein